MAQLAKLIMMMVRISRFVRMRNVPVCAGAGLHPEAARFFGSVVITCNQYIIFILMIP
jgi:ketopantoate hydroxymethyltransferase